MKKIILGVFVFFSFFGCGMQEVKLSPEQGEYMATVKSFPLEFEVLKANTYDAWGRAQSFLGKYSSMKMQTATEFVLETYNPTDTSINYGYSITKTPLNERVQITVSCSISSSALNDFNSSLVGQETCASKANKNAHMLAYYISTGRLPYPDLIAR